MVYSEGKISISSNLQQQSYVAAACRFPVPSFLPQTSPCPTPAYLSTVLSQPLEESGQSSWLFWVLRKRTTPNITTTSTTSGMETRFCLSRHLLCETCLRHRPTSSSPVWLHWVSEESLVKSLYEYF